MATIPKPPEGIVRLQFQFSPTANGSLYVTLWFETMDAAKDALWDVRNANQDIVSIAYGGPLPFVFNRNELVYILLRDEEPAFSAVGKW